MVKCSINDAVWYFLLKGCINVCGIQVHSHAAGYRNDKLHLANSKTIPALIGYFSYQNLSFTSGWPNLAAANLIKSITQKLN